MKQEYDFSHGKRVPAISTQGKTRNTINLGDHILAAFKANSGRTGAGYQTLINEVLAQSAGTLKRPLAVAEVRCIVHEELEHAEH